MRQLCCNHNLFCCHVVFGQEGGDGPRTHICDARRTSSVRLLKQNWRKKRERYYAALSPPPLGLENQGFNPTFLVAQVMVLQELGKAQNAKSYFFFAHFSGGLVKLWNPSQ